MRGYEGFLFPDYYCSYKRYPNRDCSVDAQGRERCRVIGVAVGADLSVVDARTDGILGFIPRIHREAGLSNAVHGGRAACSSNLRNSLNAGSSGQARG